MRTFNLSVALTTLSMVVPGFCANGYAQQSADSAAFIIRLGRDTISVERHIRTSSQLTIEAVQRSPSTMIHRMVVDLAGPDRYSRASYRVTQAGWDQPAVTRTVTFDRDSATIVNEQGGQSRTQRVAARDAVPMAGPFYTPYELAIMRAINSRASRDTVQLLGDFGLSNIPIEQVGSDSV